MTRFTLAKFFEIDVSRGTSPDSRQTSQFRLDKVQMSQLHFRSYEAGLFCVPFSLAACAVPEMRSLFGPQRSAARLVNLDVGMEPCEANKRN